MIYLKSESTAMLGWLVGLLLAGITFADEQWLLYKFDSRHSGNVPSRSVDT